MRKVLSISPGIEYSGAIKWEFALCLLLSWVVIFFCIWKGIRLTGKISYFTTTMPYFLIRGITLEGSADGIRYYILPDWSKLENCQVWLEACIQVFYSYSVEVTVHTALGSCNKFHHNILNGTSFLCGFVIFSALGFMANKQGVPIDAGADSGPRLAFIAYPEAISQMPLAPLWAILFFLMLVFIAIDSELAHAEAFVICILDMLPLRFRRSPHKEIVCAVFCFVWFLAGLSMVTEGGIYVEQLFEWYVGGKIMYLAFLECVILAYCYGVNRYQRNLEYMLGYRIGPFLKYLWLLVTTSICLKIRILVKPQFDEVQRKRDVGRLDQSGDMTSEEMIPVKLDALPT